MPTERKSFMLGPISPAAPGSLYQQIVDGLKREISEGRVTAGAPLPSFRVLAEDLLVSVITVKRAYEELEREGIIYRRQGLGRVFFERHMAELEAVAPPARWHRRLFVRKRCDAHPAAWIDLAQSVHRGARAIADARARDARHLR